MFRNVPLGHHDIVLRGELFIFSQNQYLGEHKARPMRSLRQFTHMRWYISHVAGLIFHARYLHSWNSGGAKMVGVGTISPRAFRRRLIL